MKYIRGEAEACSQICRRSSVGKSENLGNSVQMLDGKSPGRSICFGTFLPLPDTLSRMDGFFCCSRSRRRFRCGIPVGGPKSVWRLVNK